MKKLYSVIKNELLRYFVSPLAYVYLITFLALNASFAIYFGHLIERGIADLSPMFAYLPWLFLLFVPGIAMRLWAEEFKNKTVVQIVTMPVSINVLVWGKFLASWLFVAVALLLTFPFWVTINYLGDPDNQVIAFGYIGAWVLAGCMLSISQTMSALTKNQVVALVLSVVANFIFFLSGVEYVLGFLRMVAPTSIVELIASFSFLTHYGQVVGGLLEIKSVVFVISLIVLFNFFTVIAVSFKTSGTSRLLKSTQGLYYVIVCFLLGLVFCGINLLSNHFLRLWQYDLTEEKIYTISDESRKILQEIPENVTAKFYYSPILGQRNPALRFMAEKVILMLQRLHNVAPDKFEYKIYNPEHLSEEEDAAIAFGLQPIPLPDLNQNGFFGMVFVDAADNKQIIPVFPLERLSYLEYDIIESVYRLFMKKKVLGIVTSLPIFETNQDYAYVSQKWNIIAEIEKFYDVLPIMKAEDLAKIDVLMMVHPRDLSDEIVEAIKDYSQKGGKALVLLDTAAEAQRIFAAKNMEFYPSDLKGLDEFWGFKMLDDMITVDLENSITDDATKNYAVNPIFTQDVVQFVLPQDGFNPNVDITKNLQSILFASVSVLVENGENREFLPLLVAADNSGLMSASVVYDNISPELLLKNYKPVRATKVLAALVRPTNQENPFEVIVAADTDFVYDTFWSQSYSVLDNIYVLPMYDSANFVLNSLDYLSNNSELLPLRGKRQISRIFADMEKLRKQNMLDFHKKEHELFAQINKAKENLQEITSKRNFEERSKFTSDELAMIAKTRQNLQNLMTELRELRSKMNDSLQKKILKIKIADITLVPLLILLALILKNLFAAKKMESLTFHINREFWIIFAAALFFVAVGSAVVYWTQKGDASEYENKKVFADLLNDLSETDEIVLSSQGKELKFIFENDEWRLDGYPCLAVYQERLQRFLSVVAEMTYYEKKSNRLENLGAFGLKPLDKDENEGVLVKIMSKNKSMAEFYLGKYDIDIGRGARAAYVRFGNEFQVWMVRADFIDVSLEPADWTYSSLWNLRFGRLKGFNTSDNVNRTMFLAKELLNTKFVKQTTENPQGKTAANLTLYGEYGDSVRIVFEKTDEAIFAHYQFMPKFYDKHLEMFAKTAGKCYFEIEKQQWEKILNVIIANR